MYMFSNNNLANKKVTVLGQCAFKLYRIIIFNGCLPKELIQEGRKYFI